MLTTLAGLLALSRRELMALALLFGVTLPAVTPRVYASDEIQYVSYLRSLWFDHDVSFENEYRYFYERSVGRGEHFHETFLELQTEAGRRPNFGTIGAAILWAPFYALGHIAAALMRNAGSEIAVDGFSKPFIAAIAYGSAFYGFVAILLSIRAARLLAAPSPPPSRAQDSPALRRGLAEARRPEDVRRAQAGDSSSTLAGIAVWFGTPLLFYMYVAPPFAHACSAFAVALFVTIWLHVRRTWSPGGAVALGLAGALMAMVREQDVFFAIGPALDLVLTTVRQPRVMRLSQTALAAVTGCAVFIAGLAPQLLAYSALNGRPGPSSLVMRKMSWHSPHALDVLTSPAHGFFAWTPMALLAVSGLVVLGLRGPAESRRIGGIALVMVMAQVYVSGSVESWTVAGAFGQRRFVALTILLVIGLASLLRAVPRSPWRMAVTTALVICIWWNLALTALFGAGLMNRQRLQLQRNAYDVFVTIPRMAPDIARRYFTTRDSFYQRRDGEH